jgi:hypothetical protein
MTRPAKSLRDEVAEAIVRVRAIEAKPFVPEPNPNPELQWFAFEYSPAEMKRMGILHAKAKKALSGKPRPELRATLEEFLRAIREKPWLLAKFHKRRVDSDG